MACGHQEQIHAQSRRPGLHPSLGVDAGDNQGSGQDRGMMTREFWIVEIDKGPIP